MPRDIMLLILAVFMTQGLARGFIAQAAAAPETAKMIVYTWEPLSKNA